MINAGGATAATPVAAVGAQTFNVGGGFSRSLLPQTLDALRPSMVYDFSVNATPLPSLNDGGLQLTQGTGATTINALANAASSGAAVSKIVWMQALGLTGTGAPGASHVILTANSNGGSGDSEIGVQHLSAHTTSTAAIAQQTDILATASGGGGTAAAHFSDIVLSGTSSAVGTLAAPVSSFVHMGEGEGTNPGIQALASGVVPGSSTGGHSEVTVAGNVALSGSGDDIYTYISGIFATASFGATANVDIAGNVTLDSSGRTAHSYILVDSSADTSPGTAANVHIGGNLALDSTGSETAGESALVRIAVRGDNAGTVNVDGHISGTASGPIADGFMQLISQGASGGHVAASAVDFTVDGSLAGHGWLDLYTDHSGGLNIGTLNVSVSGNSQTSVFLQHANDATTGVVTPTFLAHAAGTSPVSIATANVGGTQFNGDVHMYLDTQGFTTVNQSSLNLLDLEYSLTGHASNIETASMTTLNGFTGAHDKIVFNGEAASATNFTNAGSFSTLAAMDTAVIGDMTATNHYVFAVYNGAADTLANGTTLQSGSGVLAYGDNGGITSVLLLPNVTSVTPTDLA